MKSLNSYCRALLARGKYFFSSQEAIATLHISPLQFKFQAARLAKQKIIKNLGHSFFMIITPEYYNFGSLPPHWIIEHFMKHLQQDYYIGLLSAASFYGATTQQPMIFQVITNKPTRPIKLERSGIQFHFSKEISSAIKGRIPSPTGPVKISSKEQTLVDLVRYYQVSGYLSNVAMVIKELAEECSAEALEVVIKNEKINTVLQRLGYILELVEFQHLADIVEREVQKRKIKYTLLQPDFPTKTGMKNKRWKIIINNVLELET